MKRKPSATAPPTPPTIDVESDVTVLMSRDADGNVNVGGGAYRFKVPPTCSALGFFGQQDIIDGDDFNDDGWVYNPNHPPRKWFVPIYDGQCLNDKAKGRVWAPKLCWENITALESLAYRTERFRQAYHLLTWKLLTGRMQAMGRFRGQVLNDPGYVVAGFVYFDVCDRGVSWDWQSSYERDFKAKFEGYDRPYLELPLNQELTDQWFAYEKRSLNLARRASKAERAFKGVLLQRCREVELKGSDPHDRSTPQFCSYRFGAGTEEPRTYLVGFDRTGDHIKLDVLSGLSGVKEVNVAVAGWTPPTPKR